MYQDIVTFMIITGAVSYTLFSLARAFRPGRSSACGDCPGCAVRRELKASVTIKKQQPCQPTHTGRFRPDGE